MDTPEVHALTKYARMSPKKLREVAREIQGKTVADALDTLRFIPRQSARLIQKTLKSAAANAENNHNLPADTLIVHRLIIEQGPTFRRFQPVARGSAHPYKKPSAHIRITLKPSLS